MVLWCLGSLASTRRSEHDGNNIMKGRRIQCISQHYDKGYLLEKDKKQTTGRAKNRSKKLKKHN